jgi:hypothetical protein
MKSISRQIAVQGHGTLFTEMLRREGVKLQTLRLRIYSDAYKFQSYAVAELHDGQRWNEIATVPYGAMATPEGLHYKRTAPTAGDFAKDRDALIADIELVLGA